MALRRVAFAFGGAGELPRYWYDGRPFESLYWTALSALFPAGERFFVRSVRALRDHVTDPGLAAEVSAFLAQEALHTREHARLNAAMTRVGVDAARVERELAPILDAIERSFSPRMNLAATCALEHFTATIAAQLLEDPAHRAKGHQAVMDLWLWHALEDVEHKSVAFDVFEAAGGTYEERAAAMAFATAVFLALSTFWHLRLLREDGRLFDLRANVRGARAFWSRGGLFGRLLPRYLDCYRRDFHPQGPRHGGAREGVAREALRRNGNAPRARAHGRREARGGVSEVSDPPIVVVGTGFSGIAMGVLLRQAGLGHNSMIVMIEAQARYAVQALQALRDRGLVSVDVRADVQRTFTDEIQARLAKSVWATGCSSWYLEEGKNGTTWPGFTLEYLWRTRRFDLARYDVVAGAAPRPAREGARLTSPRSFPLPETVHAYARS